MEAVANLPQVPKDGQPVAHALHRSQARPATRKWQRPLGSTRTPGFGRAKMAPPRLVSLQRLT